MKFITKLVNRFKQPAPKLQVESVPEVEDWTTFKRYKGDEFWLIVVNRGLRNNNQLDNMKWISIEYKFLKRELINDMFPKTELADTYYNFEDSISDEIQKIAGTLAATQTGFGSRKIWFCAPNVQLESLVLGVAGSFSSFKIDVSKATLSQYQSLLPTSLEKQWAGNETILATLAENGDDGSEPRPVSHWAYGSDASSVTELADRLETHGYVIEEQTLEKIVFSRLSILSEDQSKKETTKLVELCEQFGCNYDGWETMVVRSPLQ